MLLIARQIKAARSLLGWEQYDLARRSGVAISTIRRLEGFKDAPLCAHVETITKISRAFEAAGIEFLGSPGPGVRLCAERSMNNPSDRLDVGRSG
ncbi:MAG: transcriptional regulator [Bradyrhizobium sp.]